MKNIPERDTCDNNRKTARRILWAWGHALEEIARLEAERDAFRRWATDARDTLRAQNLTGTPRGGARRDLADVVAEADRRAEMYNAQAARIDEEIADCIRLRNVVEELIAQLTPVQREVALRRYRHGCEWHCIARKMNYGESTVRRIDDEVVDAIGRYIVTAELG